MQLRTLASYVVFIAVANLLTFGRTAILGFTGKTNVVDLGMNLLTVVAAPLCALYLVRLSELGGYCRRMAPMLALTAWVVACLLFNSPMEVWPNHSIGISLFLALILATRVSIPQLRALRLMVLLVALLFCAAAVLLARSELAPLFRGEVKNRFGVEIDDSIVIAYPRTLYVLVFTCFATVLSEKRWWLRLGAAGALILPAMVALGTGGRGPLVALLAAVVVYLVPQTGRKLLSVGVPLTIVLVAAGYWAVDTYLPNTMQRILSGDDAGRSTLYIAALSDLSIFGHGKEVEYPHNLFLEFSGDYGVIGLALAVWFLASTFARAGRAYLATKDPEVLWVLGLMVLQVAAQQFSLNIFYSMLWGALLLPIGFAAGAAPAGSPAPAPGAAAPSPPAAGLGNGVVLPANPRTSAIRRRARAKAERLLRFAAARHR